MKKTKIICTIGPASMEVSEIRRMVEAGMDCCRINTSYGDYKQHEEIIEKVRLVADVPIMLDTQGPKLRVLSSASFEKNDTIVVPFNYNVYPKLKRGMVLLFNDGADSGVITKIEHGRVNVKMSNAGNIVANRSVKIKNAKLNLPLLSKNDEIMLKFAEKNKVDFIALSYTSSADDVRKVKEKIGKSAIKVVAKIENKSGVDNFDSILKAADAVMVARGDLGIEIESSKIPLIQKDIIRKCASAGKPVIVATQMMESMIENSVPTRAETSDVANAILDGTDCLMLSGETSIGRHPSLVVRAMKEICLLTEESRYLSVTGNIGSSVDDIITHNAYLITEELDARLVCLTRSGYTARMLCRFKPEKGVIAVTTSEIVKRQLMVSYGVIPVISKEFGDKNKAVMTAKLCVEKGLIKPGELVVFTAGFFLKNTTNAIMMFKPGDLL